MTRDDLKSRVEAMYRTLRPDLRENYGLNEIKRMAIQRVREELETGVEGIIARWPETGGAYLPLATARLALFNSMYHDEYFSPELVKP
jgi:hypothetical protein